MPEFFTFADTVEHLIDYLGGNASEVVVRDCKRAATEAYRDLVNAHNWSYLYRQGRINTSVPMTTEFVTYDYSTGKFTLTNQSGNNPVWPAWAGLGTIRIGTVNFRVIARDSGTIVTCDPLVAPDATRTDVDLTQPTPFILYQDQYLLPEDYVAQDQALYEMNFGGMSYVHPKEWLYENRYIFAQGIPQCYSIVGDDRKPGRLLLCLFPFPTQSRTVDYIYKRRPRPLANRGVSSGTVTVSNGGTAVAGSGTTWDSSMVGAVLRISGNTSLPTSHAGANPPAFESVITSFTSAASIAVADAAPAAFTAAPYTISDPVEIEVGSMLNAYLRCCEKHLSMSRILKDKPSAAAQYREALAAAKDADSRSFSGRYEGGLLKFRQRLRDMPLGPDQV